MSPPALQAGSHLLLQQSHPQGQLLYNKSGQGIYVTSCQTSGVWYPLCECALATRMYPILRGDNDLLQLIAVGKK